MLRPRTPLSTRIHPSPAIMSFLTRVLATVSVVVFMAVPQAFGQGAEDVPQPGDDFDLDKLAQTSMKFLSLTVDAKSAGMANAMTAMDHANAGAMFHNPSQMAEMDGSASVMLGRASWLADINHNVAGVAYRPGFGQYGVFGFTVRSVDYGSFRKTILADNDQGYTQIGTYSPTALSVGLGYARSLTDRIRVGANFKYATQELGDHVISISDEDGQTTRNYQVDTPVFDFGLVYETGFRSLDFAFSIRNFSQEVSYADASFELPLTFRIGVAMDMMDVVPLSSDVHDLNVSIDARRSRDFDEQIRAGGEYVFMNTLALRGGYAFPTSEEAFSAGVGLQQSIGDLSGAFNYAYTDFGVFNDVHRLSVNIGF